MTTIAAPDKSERSTRRRKKARAIEEEGTFTFTVVLETAVCYGAFILEGLQFRELQKPYESHLIMSVNSMATTSDRSIFYSIIGVTELLQQHYILLVFREKKWHHSFT